MAENKKSPARESMIAYLRSGLEGYSDPALKAEIDTLNGELNKLADNIGTTGFGRTWAQVKSKIEEFRSSNPPEKQAAAQPIDTAPEERTERDEVGGTPDETSNDAQETAPDEATEPEETTAEQGAPTASASQNDEEAPETTTANPSEQKGFTLADQLLNEFGLKRGKKAQTPDIEPDTEQDNTQQQQTDQQQPSAGELKIKAKPPEPDLTDDGVMVTSSKVVAAGDLLNKDNSFSITKDFQKKYHKYFQALKHKKDANTAWLYGLSTAAGIYFTNERLMGYLLFPTLLVASIGAYKLVANRFNRDPSARLLKRVEKHAPKHEHTGVDHEREAEIQRRTAEFNERQQQREQVKAEKIAAAEQAKAEKIAAVEQARLAKEQEKKDDIDFHEGERTRKSNAAERSIERAALRGELSVANKAYDAEYDEFEKYEQKNPQAEDLEDRRAALHDKYDNINRMYLAVYGDPDENIPPSDDMLDQFTSVKREEAYQNWLAKKQLQEEEEAKNPVVDPEIEEEEEAKNPVADPEIEEEEEPEEVLDLSDIQGVESKTTNVVYGQSLLDTISKEKALYEKRMRQANVLASVAILSTGITMLVKGFGPLVNWANNWHANPNSLSDVGTQMATSGVKAAAMTLVGIGLYKLYKGIAAKVTTPKGQAFDALANTVKQLETGDKITYRDDVERVLPKKGRQFLPGFVKSPFADANGLRQTWFDNILDATAGRDRVAKTPQQELAETVGKMMQGQNQVAKTPENVPKTTTGQNPILNYRPKV